MFQVPIPDALGSNLTQPRLATIYVVFLTPPKKILGKYLDYTTSVSFQVLSNLSFFPQFDGSEFVSR
jgi:hypothetical protein